jgi:hypothetical protein
LFPNFPNHLKFRIGFLGSNKSSSFHASAAVDYSNAPAYFESLTPGSIVVWLRFEVEIVSERPCDIKCKSLLPYVLLSAFVINLLALHPVPNIKLVNATDSCKTIKPAPSIFILLSWGPPLSACLQPNPPEATFGMRVALMRNSLNAPSQIYLKRRHALRMGCA